MRAGGWKPGQSGNPKGRPRRGEGWRDTFKRMSDEVDEASGLTMKEVAARRVRELAMKGVPWAIQFWAEREEGKAAISVELGQKRSPIEQLSDEELREVIALVKQRALAREVGNEKPGDGKLLGDGK